MFDHFRTLFLYTFQINATILYLFPLSLKLQHQPIMLATILTALTAIFRSYPCVGDIGFYMALLPIWKNCSKCECGIVFFFKFTWYTFLSSFFCSYVAQLCCGCYIFGHLGFGTNRLALMDLCKLSQRQFLLWCDPYILHSTGKFFVPLNFLLYFPNH
jgi:hypothetical protein